MTKTNSTEFKAYTVSHRDDFRNATAVKECRGAISLKTNGTCIRCGYPTTTVAK